MEVSLCAFSEGTLETVSCSCLNEKVASSNSVHEDNRDRSRQHRHHIKEDKKGTHNKAEKHGAIRRINLWITSTSDRTTPETDNISTESQRCTDGQEQDLGDEARDYWENGGGRWVRVHDIARRTLFDPMLNDHPFCQNLKERRRTTVRFLGQQNEVKIAILFDRWVRFEASGKESPSFGHKICHQTTPGNPTDITAKSDNSSATI